MSNLIEHNIIYKDNIKIKTPSLTYTVQEVYNVDSVKEFEQLVTLCGWELRRQYNLTIVVWNYGANSSIRPNVKGLIYNHKNGHIMAPGVPIPLESPPENEQPVGYSQALDGIMLRVWYSPKLNHFTWSTNGMIKPGSWRGEDINFLMDYCVYGMEQIDLDELNPNFCYIVVLEHPSIPNIYRVNQGTVTLIRILEKTGVDVPLNSKVCAPFMYLNLPSSSDIALIEPTKPSPATRENFGKIAHYSNGDTYRILSQNSKNAELFRPNFSEVWQHWIYHVLDTDPNDWDFGALVWYKTYFPWTAAEIDGLTACFQAIVPPPEKLEILESPKSLKRIVDQYKQTVKDIQNGLNWERNMDDTVTVTHLGMFPDDESAEHGIQDFLNNPAQIFNLYNLHATPSI